MEPLGTTFVAAGVNPAPANECAEVQTPDAEPAGVIFGQNILAETAKDLSPYGSPRVQGSSPYRGSQLWAPPFWRV